MYYNFHIIFLVIFCRWLFRWCLRISLGVFSEICVSWIYIFRTDSGLDLRVGHIDISHHLQIGKSPSPGTYFWLMVRTSPKSGWGKMIYYLHATTSTTRSRSNQLGGRPCLLKPEKRIFTKAITSGSPIFQGVPKFSYNDFLVTMISWLLCHISILLSIILYNYLQFTSSPSTHQHSQTIKGKIYYYYVLISLVWICFEWMSICCLICCSFRRVVVVLFCCL